MSIAVKASLAGSDAVRQERTRILATLLTEVDVLARAAVAAMSGEIPAYAVQDDRFLADVTDQVTSHYRTNLLTFLDEREVTLEDIAFVRGAAMRRARAGFALEDYINAFRVGQQVLWDAIVAAAGDTEVGRQAALTLATPVMRYADFASTHAGHAYVEFRQHALADADRERRDLLEHLLDGRMPTRGALVAAAQTYGIGPGSRMLVVAATPVASCQDADAPNAARAAIAGAATREARTLVVVRQAEILAVPTLGPDADPAGLCDQLDGVHDWLRREGMPVAMGISTVTEDVGELPRAYLEARRALESVSQDGGLAALPRLSPFRYLALHADDTARRLVDPRVRTFLREDAARGGVLTATLRAFAEANLNLRVAAEHLFVHPNTAQYRLRRIEERTGRNPRHIDELLDLLVAIAVRDAGPSQG